jgi:antitoxin ParD1/3/4
MNVNLTAELESFVRNRVDSGKYNSQSEVVREGLRLLMEREDTKAASLAYLKGALDEGLTDLEEGRVYDGPRVFEQMKANIRATAT